MVQWSVSQGTPSATDYVALYAVGGQTELWRQATGGDTWGNAEVYAPTTPGNYEFRYFDGATSTVKATSNQLITQYPPIIVVPQASICQPYQPISVFYQSFSPDSGDTFGLYAVGAPSSEPVWQITPSGEIDVTYYLNAPGT
ncbi:MAG TPA: hypothetical protein VIS78_02485, partial [Blastocatellia bacterium]